MIPKDNQRIYANPYAIPCSRPMQTRDDGVYPDPADAHQARVQARGCVRGGGACTWVATYPCPARPAPSPWLGLAPRPLPEAGPGLREYRPPEIAGVANLNFYPLL